MTRHLSTEDKIKAFIGLFLILNLGVWLLVRRESAQWLNVPPPPSQNFAAAYGLGDKGFAYRVNGLMLQNMGDTGGRVSALKDYNYERLSEWFFLQDSLDNRSEYIPYLAGFYFSGVQDPQKFRPVLKYLDKVGHHNFDEKWRWLAQAVFIARYQIRDLDIALALAKKLADLNRPGMPAWVEKMPVYVMTAKGSKEDAYALMLEILKAGADTMHPSEINQTRFFICTKILAPEDAAKNSLCEQGEQP